jgi:hypothetical protein
MPRNLRAPAALIDLESSLLKPKNHLCRLQHCNLLPISAQVQVNGLADAAGKPHIIRNDAKHIL